MSSMRHRVSTCTVDIISDSRYHRGLSNTTILYIYNIYYTVYNVCKMAFAEINKGYLDPKDHYKQRWYILGKYTHTHTYNYIIYASLKYDNGQDCAESKKDL